MERKQEASSRQEAVSRGLSREAFLYKPELCLEAVGHTEERDPLMGVLRAL